MGINNSYATVIPMWAGSEKQRCWIANSVSNSGTLAEGQGFHLQVLLVLYPRRDKWSRYILLAKNWTGNVFEVQLISNRIILLQLIIGETVYTLIQCVNPNKAGLPQKKSASIASCNKSKTWFLLARYLFHLVTGMAM